MATVTVCDVCGKRFNYWEVTKYKVKIKKLESNGPDIFWTKLDICKDCQDRIVDLIYLVSKGDNHV